MKTIAFIRRGPSLREYNEAYALKKYGNYKTIYIVQSMDEQTKKLFSRVFDEIIVYNPLNFSYGKKKSFLSYLFKHLFKHFVDSKLSSITEKYRLPKTLDKYRDIDVCNCLIRPYAISNIAMKQIQSNIVFDAYDFDGITLGIENIAPQTYEWEKDDFERAGGVLHRGPPFEIDYYKKHGYNITCPALQWLDCTNKDFFVTNHPKKLSDEDGEWHIVHIGSALTYEFAEYARQMGNQNMHVHVYPTPTSLSPLMYKKFKNMNKGKYFHLHETLPLDEINQEIAKYDVGCHFHLIPIYELDYKVSHCHRFFNYLEAGLPMIVSTCMTQIEKTIVDNGFGFGIKDEEIVNLRNIIEEYDYKELRKNALKTRDKYLIDKHAKELIQFYGNVIE